MKRLQLGSRRQIASGVVAKGSTVRTLRRMQIRYTATPRDVGALLRFNLRHSPRTWISLGIVALFPAAANSLLAQVTRGRVTSADVVPGLVFGLLAVPAVLLLARLRTKNDERILSIGPEGVQTSVGKLSGAVSWARIASVGENTDYVFITGKSGNGFAIPSRAFASSAQRTEFVRRIVEYRGANGRGHR